jgi:excisionase family DNA binding protein
MKLVKEERLKSYKLGRLRRFSLEDILNYLTENNEK